MKAWHCKNETLKFKPVEKESKPKSRLDFVEFLRSPKKFVPEALAEEKPAYNMCGYSPKKCREAKSIKSKDSVEIDNFINKWKTVRQDKLEK